MLVKNEGTETYVELYWDDLSQDAQKQLKEIIGDNGNYDLFPIAELCISDN